MPPKNYSIHITNELVKWFNEPQFSQKKNERVEMAELDYAFEYEEKKRSIWFLSLRNF